MVRPVVAHARYCTLLLAALAVACDDTSTQSADATVEVDMMRRLADLGGGDARPIDAAPPDEGVPVVDAAGLDASDVDAGAPNDAAITRDASMSDADQPDASQRDPVCLELPQRPGQPPLDLSARCRARGGPIRIRDLRDRRCPDFANAPDRLPGVAVEVAEAVVTAVFSDSFTIQDPEGGPWSALWVYNRSRQDMAALRPGTRVRVHGELLEFFTLTELVSAPNTGFEILRQGDPPAPILLTNPARIADGGDLVEPLESLLLEVPWTQVLATAPDCPRDFGMFVVDGNLRIGGEAELDYEPARADVLASVTGVLHFSFDHQKLLPRNDMDLEVVVCGGVPDKCEADDCPVAPDAVETGRVVITEIQNNPTGDDNLREYFELYNPGPGRLDMTGWHAQDCAGNRVELAGGIDARAYHVRARSLDMGLNGGVRAQGDMGEMFLPNGYGSVLVFDADGTLVDQVRYTPNDDGWPRRDPGEAAELMDSASDNRLGASWVKGTRVYGDGGSGTPGAAWRR